MPRRIASALVQASCRVYGLLLALYPSDLRSEFASEMADVFEQQVREECWRHGLVGFTRVWLGVAAELLEQASPRHFRLRAVGVSSAALLSSLVLFELLLRATHLSRSLR